MHLGLAAHFTITYTYLEAGWPLLCVCVCCKETRFAYAGRNRCRVFGGIGVAVPTTCPSSVTQDGIFDLTPAHPHCMQDLTLQSACLANL